MTSKQYYELPNDDKSQSVGDIPMFVSQPLAFVRILTRINAGKDCDLQAKASKLAVNWSEVQLLMI